MNKVAMIAGAGAGAVLAGTAFAGFHAGQRFVERTPEQRRGGMWLLGALGIAAGIIGPPAVAGLPEVQAQLGSTSGMLGAAAGAGLLLGASVGVLVGSTEAW